MSDGDIITKLEDRTAGRMLRTRIVLTKLVILKRNPGYGTR